MLARTSAPVLSSWMHTYILVLSAVHNPTALPISFTTFTMGMSSLKQAAREMTFDCISSRGDSFSLKLTLPNYRTSINIYHIASPAPHTGRISAILIVVESSKISIRISNNTQILGQSKQQTRINRNPAIRYVGQNPEKIK